MVELQVQGSFLKKLMDPIKDLVDEGNFHCSCADITFIGAKRNGLYVDFMLRAEAFKYYKCDKNISLGLNIIDMTKILESAGDDDIITINADDCEISFSFESPDAKISLHSLNQIDVDYKNFHRPSFEYDVIVRMPSAKFAKICEGLSSIGYTTVDITVTEEHLKLLTRDNTTGDYVMQHVVDATIQVMDAFGLSECGHNLYGLQNLRTLTKKGKFLSTMVTLGMSSGQYIAFVYEIEEIGYVRFFPA